MCSPSHSYNDVPEMPATDAGATSDNKDLGEFASGPVLQCDPLTSVRRSIHGIHVPPIRAQCRPPLSGGLSLSPASTSHLKT